MSRDFAHNNGHPRHSSSTMEEHKFTNAKKLIVCCDGTWMDSDNGYVKGAWGKRGHLQQPSNVTRIARAIQPEDDDHHPQIVYYQAGVGTGIGLYSHLVGGGTGMGLEENIREAYSFLATNYREADPERPVPDADSIFLVGFSRGAFTARSIAGLIGAVGLLKKRAMPHFFEIFSDWENAGHKDYTPLFFDSYFDHPREVKKVKPDDTLAKDKTRIDEYMSDYFKKLEWLGLTQAVDIKVIGVFDTVGALGIPVNPLLQRIFPFLPGFVREYSWFDTRLDNHVKNAFQALALDERRFPFSPTLWEKRKGATTNLKQVWFPGSHSNVGGSYADAGIADITLAWMMDQLAGHTTVRTEELVALDWIKFDEDYIQYWQKNELEFYQRNKKLEYQGWGMGYLYDTVYFPMSLTGTRVRGPGRYHRTFYETGKQDMKNLLEGTNEHVHSSVRARIDLGGRDVEPDWNQVFPNSFAIGPWIAHLWRRLTGRGHRAYQPHHPGGPLEGWDLDDGHKHHTDPIMEIDMSPDGLKEITWKYVGDEPCGNRIMPEDKLGPFEKRLLQKDQEFAEKIMVSNNAWRWFRKTSKLSPKHGHTF